MLAESKQHMAADLDLVEVLGMSPWSVIHTMMWQGRDRSRSRWGNNTESNGQPWLLSFGTGSSRVVDREARSEMSGPGIVLPYSTISTSMMNFEYLCRRGWGSEHQLC